MYHLINHELCRLVNRVRLNLIVFGHARVNTDWNGMVLSPVYSRLYYIVGGDSSITPGGGEKINLEVGKWYLIPAGCSFHYECGGEMEHYYFQLKLCDFDGTDLLHMCRNPICIDADEDNSKFMQNCVDSENIMDGIFLQQTVFSGLLSFLQKYNVNIKTENYSPCVMKAIRYIKENLSVQLTISEVAENIFVSKSTLCKCFRRELSMSVNEYVYDLIMSEAEYMLTTGEESVQTISEKYGFYDQFYFSKRFREKFGKSPREYRNFKLL